ncbi:secretin N-terminal domain-containing protein [Pelomicrobium sp. G1]|uniref:secretin N-terminal domain-containing protein n=1 Tax=unclassified Pelomicrobium TaxID=2815318 RepID=UPI003F7623D6
MKPGWIVAIWAAAVLLAACASNPAFEEGKTLLARGDTMAGLQKLEQAAQEAPGDKRVNDYYRRQREAALAQLLTQADYDLDWGRLEEAQAAYRRALEIDSRNAHAQAGLQRIASQREQARRLEQAEQALARGDVAAAEAATRSVLSINPGNRQARRLMAAIGRHRPEAGTVPASLKGALARTVTLEFREAALKSVFEVLARTAGVNFVFDKDVRQDTKVTLFVRDSSIDDVIKLIAVTNQLERKVLNDNTLLIYPNTPAKLKEYRELVVRTFYLANADAKLAQNLVKTVAKSRDVFVDEKLNLLVVKDTPEAVRLVERLVALQDLAEPEVMLEVEVLEVGTGKLQELGIRYPERMNVGVPGASADPATGTAIGISGLPQNVVLDSGLNLKAFVANPVAVVNLRRQDSETNVLANPRIRVRNREKAKILIGEKVPVVTTTSTANVGVSSNISYLDVGLTLEVEPTVHLGDEVAIRVGLEVSNILETIEFAGALAFRLGRRTATTVLRLRDGETQVLAGLIQDDDRRTVSKLPGLGDFPVLGKLFSSSNENNQKTEIVLLITPRIVRNLDRPELRLTEFASGTDAAVGAAPLTVQGTAPGGLSLASRAPGGAAAPALSPPGEAPVPVLPPAPAALVVTAPSQVRVGQPFTVAVALPPTVAAATLELVYDPGVLSPVTPASGVQTEPGGLAGGAGPAAPSAPAPGRISISLAREAGGPAAAQFQFIALGTDGGATLLSFDRVLVTDEGGNPVPAADLAPVRLALVP